MVKMIGIGILVLTLAASLSACTGGGTGLTPQFVNSMPQVPQIQSAITSAVAGTTGPALKQTKPPALPQVSMVSGAPVIMGRANIEINLEDFSPDAITIAAGAMIHWIVPAHENHVVVSENTSVAGFPISYYTGTVDTLFTTPGTYRFHLEEEPNAICVVTVVGL
jgi:plastocyanin